MNFAKVLQDPIAPKASTSHWCLQIQTKLYKKWLETKELQDAELGHRDKIGKSHIFRGGGQGGGAAIEMISRGYGGLFS